VSAQAETADRIAGQRRGTAVVPCCYRVYRLHRPTDSSDMPYDIALTVTDATAHAHLALWLRARRDTLIQRMQPAVSITATRREGRGQCAQWGAMPPMATNNGYHGWYHFIMAIHLSTRYSLLGVTQLIYNLICLTACLIFLLVR